MSRTRIYRVYHGMIARVTNPNNISYARYGGRGIEVCDEWLDKDKGFMNFYNWAISNGYSDDLTIDRIEVNGNYEPGNCRWMTLGDQQNNRTDSHFITYGGETRTVTEWSRLLGGSRKLVEERLKLGWSEEKAVTTPPTDAKKCNSKELTYNNKTQSLKDWSTELNMNYKTLAGRLRKGWSVERAFSTPVEEKFSHSNKGEGYSA
ncbi:hypothetical protein BCP8-2_168 [Bacillus phage BCP8-2]|uniref:HNH endonuclease n=1 Tax=Bacillus phage BCP8-2 TaxID=1129192 RepID=A0A0E3D9L6_9CAUD|nr:HNH endonuclease [Bacillus phage BCP8-2]AHJ87206.1 hypothetical protein BCP8-2_168 [Bacillus phage BCP8-2]